MGLLYHYTSFQTLFEIVKPDRIIWQARYYKYFSKKDYEWIRNEAQPIVQEICKDNSWWFDPDFQMYRPYIISFCTSPNSKYMWKYFGNDGLGINLVVNEDILRNEATLLSKVPALIVPCEYIKTRWTKKGLKETIMNIANSESLQECQDDDRLLYATMGLLKEHYWKQKEIRYVTIEQKIAEVNYNDGDIIVIPYEVPENQFNKFVDFPKEMLNGIILGKDISQQNFYKARNYLISCGYSPDILKKQK